MRKLFAIITALLTGGLSVAALDDPLENLGLLAWYTQIVDNVDKGSISLSQQITISIELIMTITSWINFKDHQ